MSDEKQPVTMRPREEILKELSVDNSVEEKVVKRMNLEIPEPTKIGGKPIETRQSCKKQVYATAAVADLSANRLHGLGISTHIYRCDDCGLIHIEESR